MKNFLNLVSAELDRARAQHKTPLHSLHEGYAVILEELDEVRAEVFRKSSAQDRTRLLTELVQVAAMCMRTAEDCALLWDGDGKEPLWRGSSGSALAGCSCGGDLVYSVSGDQATCYRCHADNTLIGGDDDEARRPDSIDWAREGDTRHYHDD